MDALAILNPSTVVLIVLLLLAILTAMRGIRTVPQGEVWTVERFGAFTRMLEPGLNFIIPFIDGIGRRVNVQEQVLDIPEQSVITRDNASVAVDGIVYYRVMDPAKAAYAVQDLSIALTALAMTNIRAVIGEMELDSALSSRERINAQLLLIMDGATEPWGVKVSRVEIRRIEPIGKAAKLPPRPLLLMVGEEDPAIPFACAARTAEVFREAYRKAGRPERFRFDVFEREGHNLGDESRTRALDWWSRWLLDPPPSVPRRPRLRSARPGA